MKYRADPPEGLRIVPLDTLTAIYHRASSQTHVMAEPMPEILAVLSAQNRIPELVEGLSSLQGDQDSAAPRQAQGRGDSLEEIIMALGLTDTPEVRTLLTERLDELVATGLVARS